MRAPIGRDNGVNPLLFHRGHELESFIKLLLVYIRDLRSLLLDRQIAVPTRDIHPPLGKEARVVLQILHFWGALDGVRSAPELDGRPVASHKTGPVRRDLDKAVFPGLLLVQRTQVKPGIRGKAVRVGRKGP